MSLTIPHAAPAAPRTTTRLLHGLVGGGVPDPGLESHLERWGELHHQPHRLLEQLEASGLVGHGGAWFPVAAKWRAVVGASRRRPVVVANGAEGEPASRKDTLLLARAPHLVLDGLALAASTLRAQQAIVYVPASSIPTVEVALAERRASRLDPIAIELAESPDTFISGQESAVVNALAGRRGAVPSFVGLTTIRERGVGGRPTLVQNVETLAHVALLARFGADWFRGVGTRLLPPRRRRARGRRSRSHPRLPPRRLRGRLGLPTGLRRAPRRREGRSARRRDTRCRRDRAATS